MIREMVALVDKKRDLHTGDRGLYLSMHLWIFTFTISSAVRGNIVRKSADFVYLLSCN